MSRGRGLRARAARLSAPETAARVRFAILRSISATTRATTARAVALVVSGMRWFRLSSVPTRCTSGSTASSISGSSSSCRRLSRSIASRCITCTTVDGKYVRMSPSQRATFGAEAPSPADLPDCPAAERRPPRCAAGIPVVQRGQRGIDGLIGCGQTGASRVSGAGRATAATAAVAPGHPRGAVGRLVIESLRTHPGSWQRSQPPRRRGRRRSRPRRHRLRLRRAGPALPGW